MTSVRLCFCLLLLGVLKAMSDKTQQPACADDGAVDGDIRIVSSDSNSANNTIRGKVEICENLTWKSMCGDDWTVEDTTVACRDLGYSDLNATTFRPHVLLSRHHQYASHKYACNGLEATLADCNRANNTGDCSGMTVGVQCYKYNASFTETHSTTSTTPTNLQPSSTLSRQTTIAHHVTQSPLLQATEPTEHFPPSLPVYIYAIIGVFGILTVAVCMGLALVVCRSARRKQVISPQSQKNGIPPEESLYCSLNESQIIKGANEIAQHHVYHEIAASYVPVYEDIQSSLKDSNIPIPEPCDCGGDQTSQKNGGTQLQYATPESDFSRQGTTENTAMHQQGSFSQNKQPPIKGKTCAPYTVNPLAFQKSPTEKEFNCKVSNDYTTAASSLGEQQGSHEYAVLEGPNEHHTTDSTLHNGHYPFEGELVGGHHYAILEHNHT